MAIKLPIFPVAFGTSLERAAKISHIGFTPELAGSNGLLGTGTYVSTSLVYSIAQAASFDEPVIVLAFASPGNIYPATDRGLRKNLLEGKPLKPGYQAHFSLSRLDGSMWLGDTDEAVFGELVIAQESQLCPFCFIELDKATTEPLIKKYGRTITNQ